VSSSTASAPSSLIYSSAVSLARRIRSGELSALDVVRAHIERIEAVNPALNAIVTFLPERALAAAKAADERQARGEPLGPVHGLPIAHKDLVMTAGIRSTMGSKLLEHHVPKHDDLIVERIRNAGAICVGKTNTPEFGAGSQTFNEVFGETRNPYDPTKTCGGSSGGAAVALAAGMLPIADGSDMGGSLRNPASFCNVVGMRGSPGRVPVYPAQMGWSDLSVLGPMARNVEDVALLSRAMAGHDPRSPIAIRESGEVFAQPLARDFAGTRIGWSRDLGGLPVDPRVTTALEARRDVFGELGCVVADAEPDWTGADEIFKVLRAWSFAVRLGATGEAGFQHFKDTVRWNVEQGQRLTAQQIGEAEVARTRLYQRTREFMETYEFLVLPVSQVPPFPIEERWVREIDGVAMESYIDWMKSCYFITLTGHPAISVPCGFTPEGLPVGIQIVGRHQDDWGTLQLAYAFEQATGTAQRHPRERDLTDWQRSA
jgi:amidase